MSKKVNNQTTDATVAATLEQLMQAHTNVSLRRLAQASELNYPRLLKASKAPVEGQKYDPTAINFIAIEQVFGDKGIDYTKLDWEELNRQSTRPEGTLVKDIEKFPNDTPVWLRKNNETPYLIVYRTRTHVVLQLEGTEELLCWSHSTFLLNGPMLEKRA